MKRRTALGMIGGAAITTTCALSQNQALSSKLPRKPPRLKLGTEPPSQEYFGLNIGTELSLKSFRDQLLTLYQKAGVRWLRVWYNWATLEPEPGVYDGASIQEALRFAKNYNFQVLFMIWGTPPHAGNGDLGDVPQTKALSDYCQWLKANLGDLVDAWEIGNEPNLTKYYAGSPESYIQTLATTYQQLQGDAPVVAAGPSGAASSSYWQALLDNGLERYCDRVNLHPYRNQPQQVVRLVDDFLGRVQKPLWITELGLSADVGGEQVKADFVAQVLPLLATRVEKLFWYRGVQGSGLHPLRFGLIEGNRTSGQVTPLPAYYSYAAFAAK